jgi:hypothetical protein
LLLGPFLHLAGAFPRTALVRPRADGGRTAPLGQVLRGKLPDQVARIVRAIFRTQVGLLPGSSEHRLGCKGCDFRPPTLSFFVAGAGTHTMVRLSGLPPPLGLVAPLPVPGSRRRRARWGGDWETHCRLTPDFAGCFPCTVQASDSARARKRKQGLLGGAAIRR